MRVFTLYFLIMGLGCGFLGATPQAKGEEAMTLAITSPAFADHAEIPKRYTGEGENISPPLSFSGEPKETKSLALIVDDPDAPDPAAPQHTWVHWVLFNIPPAANSLDEGVKNLPIGTIAGLNDWRRTGYGGPMPPIGRHRYFFKLYALDKRLGFYAPPDKAGLETAMKGHILAEAELVGTYEATHK